MIKVIFFQPCRCLITLALVIAASITTPLIAGNQVTPEIETNPFRKLVKFVAESGDTEQRDFAWIAVSEVAHAYRQALSQSNEETPSKLKRQQKLVRWRNSTEAFYAQLQEQLNRLANAEQVTVKPTNAGPVVVFISSEAVVISGPEMNKTKLMERRIIDNYCQLHSCTALHETPPPQQEAPKVIEQGSWSISRRGQGRYQTPDGLHFHFSNLKERREKQQWCENIAEDLRLITEKIRQAKRAGYPIDWSSIKLDTLINADKAHLQLNKDNDYLAIPLRLLAKTDLMQGEVLHWVQQAVNGLKQNITIIHADQPFNHSG